MSISTSLTPGGVGKRPVQFVGECISWAGIVMNTVEAHPCTVEVPGGFRYVGKAIVEIWTLPSGRTMDHETLGDRFEEEVPMRCLYGDELMNIKKDDVVEFSGKIIAETTMEGLSLRKNMRKAPVIGLQHIQRIEAGSARRNLFVP